MSFQIPTYFLIIEQTDLEDLKCDMWNDAPVPAYLQVEDNYYDIDICYRGSYTREFRKKSYMIEFVQPNTFYGARVIHLNAEYKDPSLIRNKLSLDFFQDIGVLSPDSQHVNLTINGSLQGVYLQLESVDEMFIKKRGLPLGPIYYAVGNGANFSLFRKGQPKYHLAEGYQRAFGNESDDELLIELISKINDTPISHFPQEIAKYIDIEKYLRWMAGAVCTMNNDGFTHNYALYRNSVTGLFEIIPWDYDATWGRKVDGGLMRYNYVPIGGKKDNHLTNLLLQASETRKRYKEILEGILETAFTVQNLENKVNSLHQALRPHVLVDPYKKNKIQKYDQEPEVIFQFIRDRSAYLKRRLPYLDL